MTCTNKFMDKVIKEYTLAINAHLQAQQNELTAKQTVLATHYRLLLAKDALRAKEQEILQDMEIKTI